MKKHKLTPIGAAVAALVLLVVLFLARGALHRPARIVLPSETADSAESGEWAETDASRVNVRTDTVQSVIATLERPARYSREITIERCYSGGSGVDRCSVWTDGAWTRADITRSSGETSHAISGGGRIWLWYGSGTLCYENVTPFSADEEQGIPTYEDLLRLDTARIAAADYRLLDGTDCIYVETAPDDSGYIERYWVGVSSGLLCAAEKLRGEEVVYRMAGLTISEDAIADEVFTLPDGTVLRAAEPSPDEADE